MQLIDDVGGEAGGPTIQDQFFRPELSEAGSFPEHSGADARFRNEKMEDMILLKLLLSAGTFSGAGSLNGSGRRSRWPTGSGRRAQRVTAAFWLGIAARLP